MIVSYCGNGWWDEMTGEKRVWCMIASLMLAPLPIWYDWWLRFHMSNEFQSRQVVSVL